jgi:hypothetical protein
MNSTLTDTIAASSIVKEATEQLIKRLPFIAEAGDIIPELNRLSEESERTIESDPEALLCNLFVNAIKAHYEPKAATTQHLYLERYEIPQIRLFDLLINRFPFVVTAHAISNQLICDWAGDHKSVVVLDIGLGRGIQMASLIDRLAENKSLRELTIIGVEPFADAIPYAMNAMQQAALNAHFKVNLHTLEMFAEDVEAGTLKQLLPEHYDKIIVNASLALHHIQSAELRQKFFDNVSQLGPDAMVLTEPHTDHLTSDWCTRVYNAWLHYGAIFDTIDQLMITSEEQKGLKLFFGREINDVVGLPEDKRVERHEPADNWVAYGAKIGMTAHTDPGDAYRFSAGDSVDIWDHQRYLMMSREATDVLAIIPMRKSADVMQ